MAQDAPRDLLDRSPLTSRERVRRATSRPPCSQALPDRVPLDLGENWFCVCFVFF